MLHRSILMALLGVGATAALTATASAGEWRCGGCGYRAYAPGAVYYAAPTYTYAPPIVTVVPRYIVQPQYIVEKTYVLRPTYYVRKAPRQQRRCRRYRGLFVNQGQYDSDAATLVGSRCY